MRGEAVDEYVQKKRGGEEFETLGEDKRGRENGKATERVLQAGHKSELVHARSVQV